MLALTTLVLTAFAPSTPLVQVPQAPHVPAQVRRRIVTTPWTGPADMQDLPYPPFTPFCVFDWYAPPYAVVGQSGAPVLFFVHGGGFDELNGETLDPTSAPFAELRRRGYAIVSVRYRQKPSGVFGYDMARDAAYVVQLLRSQASTWSIDPNRIVGYGASSGAFVLGMLAYADDFRDLASPDPVLHESSRIDAFVNDRCESDWLHFVDASITIHPFNSSTLVGVPIVEKERASALWWLAQPGAVATPTISYYRAPVHAPPLVNLHDGWLGQELASSLTALGCTDCPFTVYAPPLPWHEVYDWLYRVVGW